MLSCALLLRFSANSDSKASQVWSTRSCSRASSSRTPRSGSASSGRSTRTATGRTSSSSRRRWSGPSTSRGGPCAAASRWTAPPGLLSSGRVGTPSHLFRERLTRRHRSPQKTPRRTDSHVANPGLRGVTSPPDCRGCRDATAAGRQTLALLLDNCGRFCQNCRNFAKLQLSVG